MGAIRLAAGTSFHLGCRRLREILLELVTSTVVGPSSPPLSQPAAVNEGIGEDVTSAPFWLGLLPLFLRAPRSISEIDDCGMIKGHWQRVPGAPLSFVPAGTVCPICRRCFRAKWGKTNCRRSLMSVIGTSQRRGWTPHAHTIAPPNPGKFQFSNESLTQSAWGLACYAETGGGGHTAHSIRSHKREGNRQRLQGSVFCPLPLQTRTAKNTARSCASRTGCAEAQQARNACPL